LKSSCDGGGNGKMLMTTSGVSLLRSLVGFAFFVCFAIDLQLCVFQEASTSLNLENASHALTDRVFWEADRSVVWSKCLILLVRPAGFEAHD
jgi:hypothetical protein